MGGMWTVCPIMERFNCIVSLLECIEFYKTQRFTVSDASNPRLRQCLLGFWIFSLLLISQHGISKKLLELLDLSTNLYASPWFEVSSTFQPEVLKNCKLKAPVPKNFKFWQCYWSWSPVNCIYHKLA